jgi:hypothetical protein
MQSVGTRNRPQERVRRKDVDLTTPSLPGGNSAVRRLPDFPKTSTQTVGIIVPDIASPSTLSCLGLWSGAFSLQSSRFVVPQLILFLVEQEIEFRNHFGQLLVVGFLLD